MPYATEEIKEVRCPKCGGHTWDNRATKRNPKAPDYKCRDKACDGAIWPEKNPAPRSMPQPEVRPVATSGKQPYETGPHIPAIDGPAPGAVPALDALFNVYSTIESHVLATSPAKFEKAGVGASPESIAAQIATLFIAAKDAGLTR